MPAPTGARVFRAASIEIDEVEYANQVRVARLVPDTPIQTYRTLVPDGAVSDVDSTVWTFQIDGLQINTTGGLADALRDAAGTEVEVILSPYTGTGAPTATFTIIALPTQFGGEQGAWLTTGELSFPVVGAPVFGVTA
ncbi:MAG TPA: hypothetical protein VD864_15010 [Nocardioides sp.]|nr:hypothetical protein [Nocardioides sp.]